MWDTDRDQHGPDGRTPARTGHPMVRRGIQAKLMEFFPLAEDARDVLSNGSRHGRLARAFGHWRSLAAQGSLPAFQQLQLSSLAPDLRFLAALRVDGPDFCFVSVGDEIAERYGRNLVGNYLADQFTGPSQMDFIAAHKACVELRSPVVSEVGMNHVDRSSRVPFQQLLLPFANADGDVDHILWVMAFPT